MNWYLIITDYIKTSDSRALGTYIPIFSDTEILAKDDLTARFILSKHHKNADLCHVTSDQYDYKDIFLKFTNQFDLGLN